MRYLGDYFELDISDVVCHYGIRGQKWGIRRFQNPDMTWTEAGKIRYGKTSSKQTRLTGQANTKIDHNKAGSTRGEVARLIVSAGISAVTLNPIGAVQSLHRAGQAASAYSKEKIAEKRIAKADIDEKTGLPLKRKDTTADQDVKLVNPGFKNFNTNTKNNCVLCSTAFELRRRGYDVVASKAAIGYTSDEYKKWFKGLKTVTKEPFTLQNSMQLPSRKKGKELTEWITPKLLSQGDGARGYLSVQFGPAAGHSMVYEVQNGKVVVYDAQSGKKKSLQSIMNISVNVGFSRFDNLEPNFVVMKKDGVI